MLNNTSYRTQDLLNGINFRTIEIAEFTRESDFLEQVRKTL